MQFIGVDVHLKSMTVASIGEDLCIKFLGHMSSDDLIDFVDKSKPSIIAVDAPFGLNKGLMNDEEYRSKISKDLKGHYNKKVSEYELSRRGIIPFSTPESIDEVTGWLTWMKTGFELYERLESLGYRLLNEESGSFVRGGIIEVFPHACFTTLAGYILESKSADVGLEERISVLEGVGIKGIREAITGNKHERADRLDALAAAYTACAIYNGQASFLGDIDEGQIAVPVKEIKEKYKRGAKKCIDGNRYNVEPSGRNVQHNGNRYLYKNLDSVIWLKHFIAQDGAPNIYLYLNLIEDRDKKVFVTIESLDGKKLIDVVLEPIKDSVHGLKAVVECKKALKEFWGSHGDNNSYFITVNDVVSKHIE